MKHNSLLSLPSLTDKRTTYHNIYTYSLTTEVTYMLLKVPNNLLEYINHNKHSSIPVFILKCVAYCRDNNIPIEDIINTKYYQHTHDERVDNDSTERDGRYRKDSSYDPM